MEEKEEEEEETAEDGGELDEAESSEDEEGDQPFPETQDCSSGWWAWADQRTGKFCNRRTGRPWHEEEENGLIPRLVKILLLHLMWDVQIVYLTLQVQAH